MPSFDVVSEVNMHELANAVDQANREIANRYDFKGADAKVLHQENTVTIEAQSKFQIEQIDDILIKKIAKRGIDLDCMKKGEIEESSNRAKRVITIIQGIETEVAKKIVKLIKDTKLKVQASIQGEKIRITGKNKDDLQTAISTLRNQKVGIPLQFNNFRD